MYMLLVGDFPFQGTKPDISFNNIQKQPLNVKQLQDSNISQEAVHLINGMLEKKPENRISITTILKKPWFDMPDNELTDKDTKILLKHLKEITSHGSMIDFLSSFLAQKSTPNQETETLTRMFKTIDINGDGRITKDEILMSCEKLNMVITNEHLDEIFKKYDKSKTGTLEYSEFIAAFMDKQRLLQKESIEEFFEFIDQEKDGFISLDDFKAILAIEKDDCQEVILFKKKSGMGHCMTKNEFVSFVSELIQKQLGNSKNAPK